MPDEKPQPSSPSSEKDGLPPAGPHATPEQTDEEKTPGTGSLPDSEGGEADVGSE